MTDRLTERETWGSPSWTADVRAWLATLPETRAATGLDLEPVQSSLWSSLWRVDAGDRRWWFKQNLTSQRHEGSVQTALARLGGRWVDPPVATEPDRGWMLSVDGGVTAYAAAGGDARQVPIEDIGAILVDYADLQRATVGQRDILTGAGLSVRDPRDAATRALACAARMAAHPTDDPRHLSDADVDLVRRATPALTEAANTLAGGPVPLCFDHGDLFVGNVFRPRRRGHPWRFFDLAESAWAHPFGSLVMLVWELAFRWEIEMPDHTVDLSDPRLRAVLDTYLGCWTDVAPLAELRGLTQAALRIAALHRAVACLDKLEHARPETGDHLSWMWQQPRNWLLDVTRPVRL